MTKNIYIFAQWDSCIPFLSFQSLTTVSCNAASIEDWELMRHLLSSRHATVTKSLQGLAFMPVSKHTGRKTIMTGFVIRSNDVCKSWKVERGFHIRYMPALFGQWRQSPVVCFRLDERIVLSCINETVGMYAIVWSFWSEQLKKRKAVRK